MTIRTLRLSCLGPFEYTSFDIARHITVVLGEGGSGKTHALRWLHACAASMASAPADRAEALGSLLTFGPDPAKPASLVREGHEAGRAWLCGDQAEASYSLPRHGRPALWDGGWRHDGGAVLATGDASPALSAARAGDLLLLDEPTCHAGNQAAMAIEILHAARGGTQLVVATREAELARWLSEFANESVENRRLGVRFLLLGKPDQVGWHMVCVAGSDLEDLPAEDLARAFRGSRTE